MFLAEMMVHTTKNERNTGLVKDTGYESAMLGSAPSLILTSGVVSNHYSIL